jgi:hypothetical protein
MSYKPDGIDEQMAGWRKLMQDDPDAINEMMVKRPMVKKKKRRSKP